MAELRFVVLATVICLQAFPNVLSQLDDKAEELARRIAGVECVQNSDCAAVANAICEPLTMYCQAKTCTCPWGLTYVDGFYACAQPVAYLGEPCNEYRGCGSMYSRCTNGFCQCQPGYAPMVGMCMMALPRTAKCDNPRKQVTIKDGKVSVKEVCKVDQRTAAPGLSQTCSGTAFCGDRQAVCLQCDPFSPILTCSLLPPPPPSTTAAPNTTVDPASSNSPTDGNSTTPIINGAVSPSSVVGLSALFGGLFAAVLF